MVIFNSYFDITRGYCFCANSDLKTSGSDEPLTMTIAIPKKIKFATMLLNYYSKSLVDFLGVTMGYQNSRLPNSQWISIHQALPPQTQEGQIFGNWVGEIW